MSKNLQDGLAEYAEIRFLTPKECLFSCTPGGFLSLQLSEVTYSRVSVYRSFPLSLGDRYLSVRDDKEKEIGLIKDLAQFPDEAARLVRQELERRYFTPVVKSVQKIKEEFGYIYWDVDTNNGPRRFTTRSSSEALIPVSDTRLLVLDVDGNRFDILDYRQLDAKSVHQIELML